MKQYILLFIALFAFLGSPTFLNGQTASTSDYLTISTSTDRSVYYNLNDTGISKPIIWGLDLAWLSEANIRRGIAFMGGKENVDLVRSSFMPTDPVENGELTDTAYINTMKRIDIIDKWLSPNVGVVLNSDHPSVHPWYYGNAAHWAEMIDVTARYHEEKGYKVITASPFNEPDYSFTGQGSMQDFYNIVTEMRKNPRFDSIRISGGNTLNNDVALTWYNYLNPAGLDEGNTHQLAGSFDNYARFFEEVRAKNDHATADELHNVMEAMVGVEYGMQTGIWWGTAEYARGEFCKASDGKRLGYAEHRPNWTAASVYRAPDGKVQAFGGCSERQSVSTTYKFISKDRNVYYNGYGPTREYIMDIPGGEPGTYQTPLHTNAENVVNIAYGEDIQPVVNGRYYIANRKSGMLLTILGSSLVQYRPSGSIIQQWDVNPVNTRIGGDFSYFKLTNVKEGTSPDVLNWSLENGGDIIAYNFISINQQWYLEYAEDGWFYIRSRHSAKCMEVKDGSSVNGANVQQWDVDGDPNQQWRFIPVDAPIEFVAPTPPVNLVATANNASIKLAWEANNEADLSGYTLLRAESPGGPYQTIARDIKTNAIVDNTVVAGIPYFYVVKAVDNSLNSSSKSAEVSATASGDKNVLAQFLFEGNAKDSTANLFHGTSAGELTFTTGKVGNEAIVLNGSDAFIRLAPGIADHKEMTIATWVNWNGGAPWQRIFEFAADDDTYFYLSPQVKLVMKTADVSEQLQSSALTRNKWTHVAVTLGEFGAQLYVDGNLADEKSDSDMSPENLNSLFNYIGKSSLNIPLFNGQLDDFVIYNYALNSDEIAQVYARGLNTGIGDNIQSDDILVWPTPTNKILNVALKNTNLRLSTISLYNLNGSIIKSIKVQNSVTQSMDISMVPSGTYLLKLEGTKNTQVKKIIVSH